MSHSRIVLCLASLVAATAVMAADFESPPKLVASEILSPSVVKGDHYEVDAKVTNIGFLNYYGIESDFGRFEAKGTTQLVIRLREIGALGELDALSKTDVFADAVKEGATQSVKAIGTIASRPVETLKGLPTGAKRLFGRTKRSVEAGVEMGKDVVDHYKDDDCEGEDCEVESCEGEDCEAEAADDKPSRAQQAGALAEGYADKYFGISAGQRRWAQKLGVDPYTTNQVLLDAIAKVAKVDSAGRFAVRLAPIPRIPGARTISKVNSLVWTMDAFELVQYNKGRLVEAGADPEVIDAFYLNPFYNPTRQTLLFTALLSLDTKEGVQQALSQAGSAESDEEAQFFVAAAQMLQWFNSNESPIVRMLPGLVAFVAEADDGRIVFLLPIDYLSWTAEVAGAARGMKTHEPEASGGIEFWVLGDVSERCKSELENLGWKVRDSVGKQVREAVSAAE